MLRPVAALNGRVFDTDPVIAYMLLGMSQQQRLAYLPTYWTTLIRSALLNDAVITEADSWKSASVLIPPGGYIDNVWTLLWAGFLGVLWKMGLAGIKVYETPTFSHRTLLINSLASLGILRYDRQREEKGSTWTEPILLRLQPRNRARTPWKRLDILIRGSMILHLLLTHVQASPKPSCRITSRPLKLRTSRSGSKQQLQAPVLSTYRLDSGKSKRFGSGKARWLLTQAFSLGGQEYLFGRWYGGQPQLLKLLPRLNRYPSAYPYAYR